MKIERLEGNNIMLRKILNSKNIALQWIAVRKKRTMALATAAVILLSSVSYFSFKSEEQIEALWHKRRQISDKRDEYIYKYNKQRSVD